MLIRLLRTYLRRYKRQLVIVLVLQAAQTIAALYLPSLNADIIDKGVARGDTGYIWSTGGMMLLITLVQVTCAASAVYFGAKAAMGFGRDVRSGIFHQVSDFSAREMGQFGAPSLITRITNDVQQVQMLVLMTCTLLVAAPITAIGGVVMAIREDGGLSWILTVSIPVLVICILTVVSRMVPQFRKMQERIDTVNRVLREQITGIRVVRAFVREPAEAKRFGDVNTDLTNTALRAGRLQAFFFPIVILVLNSSSVAVLWFGSGRIDKGQMQIGALIAFLSYLAQIIMAVMMATFMVILVPRASVCAERIVEVLDTPSSVVRAETPITHVETAGRLELRDVGFHYPGAEAPVLTNVSLLAEPGQVTAIIGSTGSGKTTLLSLIPRLFDVTSGAVLVDGVDVRDLDPDTLWGRIGLVPQKPYLFSGTVASNLRFADPDATDEQLWAALEIAQATDFVRAMPGGLQAPIAQGGSNVSGGQRQRLAIARALVRRPEIYLFDDSFSALDLATDARLRAALTPYTADATVIIVAQRVSTIVHADQIMVLEDGECVGVGTHTELLETCPTYREIVESQLTAEEAAVTTHADPRPGHEPDDDAVVRPPEARPAASPGPMRAIGMPAEKSKDFGGSTKRLLERMRIEKARGIAVVCFALLSVTLTVLGPKLLGHGTDLIFNAVRQHRHIDFPALRGVLLTVLALYVCAAGLSYLQSYTLAGVVQRTVYRLRSDVEDKLSRLPLSYVDGQPRGDLLSRVTNDIDNISQSLQQTLSQLLTSVLTLIGVLVMMFIISPILALVAALTIPSSLLIIRFVTSRSKKRFVAQWRHTGTLNAQIEEAFTGHALVKVFGQQHEVEERFRTKNEELYGASFGAQFISGIIQPAMMFLGNINYVAIAVIGGLRVSSGSLSLGDVQAFIQYSRQFTQPMTQLASMANVLQSGVASAERVFELLDAPEQSPDPADPVRDLDPRGRVEFEHVAFSYDPKNPLIADLSLVAEPGQTIAIVGPTGAGKTTLVNLIMRFYEIDSGRITLDGINIADMTRHDLRANVGMVLQDTWLFSGTIRDNIMYGNLECTEEQFHEAVRATYVDRFVHSLPDGYDTLIDDEGGTVSAGEKQLLTIARAFLADPSILILDEATSSVDTRTEVLIQKAMAALRSQRTSFVIAHRLSTIRDADLILVMESGNIVEQGTHEELLHSHGAYFDLYNAQFAAPAAEVP